MSSPLQTAKSEALESAQIAVDALARLERDLYAWQCQTKESPKVQSLVEARGAIASMAQKIEQFRSRSRGR